jgi:outer membrane protein assembly factor BamA
MRKLTSLILFLWVFSLTTLAQEDSIVSGKKEKIKKGFSFGGVPAIAYDTDIGFKYGAVVNLYDYGDGSRYPEYDHSLYLEWSRTTKGNGINQIVYDSEKLIPNMRVTAEVSYMTEKALDFYGFNGYEAYYNHNFEDQDNTADYISRVFYRYERKSLRLKADFMGNIIGEKLRWLAGISYNSSKIGSVDIDKLNKGKDDADKLPDVPGLYDYYVQWGIIPTSQADGGNNTQIKLGLVYDTRDIEANPGKGLWEELMLFTSPKAFGYESFTTTALFLHRQYFTLFPGRLTFAYRLGYQAKLSGDIPYYMLPYYTDSKQIRDGFGGSKTVRGVLRDRIVGDGVALGNLEFRWKCVKTYFLKQNLYIALSAFLDGASVLDPYSFDMTDVPATFDINGKTYNRDTWFKNKTEGLHLGYGAGVHLALNENFIVAIDYGLAAKKDDGKSGLYINLNWLF